MQLDQEIYARILDNLHDGLYFVDTDRIITYWNKGAERITGFSAAEVVGRSCSDNILSHVDGEGNSLCFGCCPLGESIGDGRERESEIYLHHKDGHRVPVFVRVSTLRDAEGNVLGGLELFTDMSTILVNSARVQELEKLAMLDTLTRLANRNYLEREFRARFEKLQRYQESFGVLFIDIDHFKKVNDVYGHDVGDKILQFVATNFTANSRPFDLYGRWGGEEFIGLIRNTGPEDLALLGNRLRMLIEHSYILHENQKLSVNISLGATMATESDTMDSLLKRADVLLYESKVKGRNRLTLG